MIEHDTTFLNIILFLPEFIASGNMLNARICCLQKRVHYYNLLFTVIRSLP